MRYGVWVVGVLAVFGWGHDAAAAFADGVYVPPVGAKALDASLYPIAPETVASYLERFPVTHVFDEFAGRNDELAAGSSNTKPIEIGANFDIDMASPELLDEPFTDGDWRVYLAGVTSIDAHAVRLRLDLSELTSADEVWVIDPNSARAFGPFTQADAVDGGRWLPTIAGDTAVLMVRTTGAQMPQVRLLGLSHFYRPLEEVMEKAALSCNINVACEADPDIQEMSSGVGLIVVTTPSSSWSGSGSLINNPDTPELEAYFLTANHVVGNTTEATGAEVFWDVRSTSCDVDDSPLRSEVPRSDGQALLTTNATLDVTLIRLDTVPVGEYGRAYLGWDSRRPQVGDDVLVMHYPKTTHMRVSYGSVRGVNRTSLGYRHQVKLGWDDGVTEGGSSGSTFLYANTLRIGGTLSNGPMHICGAGPTYNYDHFGSFEYFFSDISPEYLPADDEKPGFQCAFMAGSSSGGTPSVATMTDMAVFGVLLSCLILARKNTRRRIG